jgi:hypothetical protein
MPSLPHCGILLSVLFLFFACSAPPTPGEPPSLPRVFVFTDINIDDGDPDDRQSLVHLLWYANEVEIEGIVPDRWSAQGYRACSLAVNAYADDFRLLDWRKEGYPEPEVVRTLVAPDYPAAEALFQGAAADTTSPLYVLVWGNMLKFGDALRSKPALANNLRVISIGTGLMREKDIPYLPEAWPRATPPCRQYNWNGFGRDRLFADEQFRDLWWLELNWTYAGMFSGPEPKLMWDSLATFGTMGEHLITVTENQPWARYFRVGDTPSLLYVIDPDNDLDDPTTGSWAGKFVRPFPEDRPNFFTDDAGSIPWNYRNPCASWSLHPAVAEHAQSTLENRRPGMYTALLEKLRSLY